MSKRGKVSPNYIVALLATVIVFLITLESSGKYLPYLFIENTIRNTADTPVTRTRADTSIFTADTSRNVRIDTSTRRRDSLVQSVDTFHVKFSKDSLDAPINYAAEDSGVLLIPSKQFILYGKANTKYTDIEMDAAIIRIDQEKNLVTAYGAKDTLGNPLDKPRLKQGETVSNSDSIFYNLKTQKGLTKSSYLQEGEMFVYANTVKKVDENTLYAWRGRFTTCNLDTPHFAFRTRKMKIINKKLAVSGPASPEFEGVPVPIGIPFGIYPLNRGRHSGLLPPQFAANEDFGLGLEGLGYYKVLNEYADVTVRSNIYSYGGWNLNIAPTYMKRYRFNGGLDVAIQNTKILNRTGYQKEEFTSNKSFMINWHHAVNPKARPGTNFSANVNAGSTRFNQYVPNNNNINFQNQLSSSISYSKDWGGKYNLSVNATHSQNNATRLINLSLPNISFNAVTVYPFQRKEQVGSQKWYEKLGIGYTGSLQNQVSFYDSAFNLRQLLDTTQWFVNHSIPISLSLPQLGPVQLSPSMSYSERWFGQAQSAYYDTTLKAVRTKATRGFNTDRETQFSFSASTRIFGTYNFKKSSAVKAIRHEIRPQLSFTYKPDLNKQNFNRVQADSTGRIFLPFSTITGQQVIGDRRFAGMSFGIDNLLEMKARNRKDTSEGGVKKIRLIDGFGFSSAYNFLADSFRLQPFRLYAQSTLFEKINISASATLDPYQLSKDGLPVNKFAWSDGRFNPGRISNGQIAISTSFASKSKDGKTQEQRLPKDDYMTPDEQQRQLDYVRANPAEFTDFNIPWNVSLSYSLSYSKSFNPYAGGFQTAVYSNVSVNGDFSLTPRWKVGGSTYFDFTTAKIQSLSMFISREMHCWQMSINLAPVGLFRSFNITINPKSGILRDLKINRSRYFYNQ